MNYQRTTLRIAIHRDRVHPLQGTILTVDDAGGGPYLVLEQDGKAMTFDPGELDLLAQAGRELIAQHSMLPDEL